jgi:hypothetical protein
VIARRQTEHGSGLGRHRWVVERTFAWLHSSRPPLSTRSTDWSCTSSNVGSRGVGLTTS